MDNIKLTAPCIFGIEAIAASEFRRMGFEKIETKNGRVDLYGGPEMLARANICSRYAERIYINIGEFQATSFAELFDGVYSLEWERFIGKNDAFPVNGHSIDSALYSIPDCQKIVKKAIAKRLGNKYGVNWLDETGPEYKIRFSIIKNTVTMMIDTSGEPLHKRGYRRNSNDAPIKETLAAAMCDTARIYPDTVLFDPFCGSGTILIEAALMATNTAPGLRRFFAAERFSSVDQKVFSAERARALDLIRRDIQFEAYGLDIDESAVALTVANAQKAGVGKYIKTRVADFSEFTMPEKKAAVITNPPYGERLLDVKQAEELYKVMGTKFLPGFDRKYYVISPDDDFEKIFGRPADKRRKLYNGMLKCQLYMYFK